MSNPQDKKNKAVSRSSARLAAVQALYEVEMSDAVVDDVLSDFLARKWDTQSTEGEEDRDESPITKPDHQLFTDLLRGVPARQAQIDEMINAALNNERTIERLEAIVRATLRAGAYELFVRHDIPPRVTISEYVDVTHAFFEGPEPKFVNGVLDRLAHTLRADELKPRNGANPS